MAAWADERGVEAPIEIWRRRLVGRGEGLDAARKTKEQQSEAAMFYERNGRVQVVHGRFLGSDDSEHDACCRVFPQKYGEISSKILRCVQNSRAIPLAQPSLAAAQNSNQPSQAGPEGLGPLCVSLETAILAATRQRLAR